MPPLSQRPRRRRFHDERTERQRPHQRQPVAEEEEDEEEEEGEEEGDYEDEEGPEEPVHLRGSGPSQQRQRLPAAASRARVEEDSEADDDDDDGDDDPRRPQADRQVAYQELLAKKLVRYALACEPRRQPIRRQAVKEQVLDNQGKHFRSVFPMAQAQLRAIFGMEMVEWPARDETTMSVRERRKALRTKKAPAPAASAANTAAARVDRYVLASSLPEEYRTCVFTPIPSDPIPYRNAPVPLAAIPPAPDAAFVGFYTLVVSLITLNGGSMSHTDLEKYLSMLNGAPVRADDNFLKPIPETMGDHIDDDDGGGAASSNPQDGDGVSQGGTMHHLVRQGYVMRVVEEPTTAEGRGAVGGRGAGGSSGVPTGSKITWHVGPRGRLEVGPAEVAAVVRHIYGPDAGEGLERRLEASLRPPNNERRQAAGAGREEVPAAGL